MADLIKYIPLVKIATVRRKDLDQMGHCAGLRLDDKANTFSQKEAGKERRELVVLGWFQSRSEKYILVRRVDDGRLLQQMLYHEIGRWVAKHYPQIFVR